MAEDTIDPLDLSDEDFEQLSDEAVAAMFEQPAVDKDSDDSESDDDNNETDEGTTNDDEEEEENQEDKEDEEVATDEGDDAAVGGEPDADEETESDSEDSDSDESEDEKGKDEDPSAAISAEDFMKEITAPFRANGKEMQIDSVEDVKKLMQMGANYNKKMAAIKPNLKFIKMLENNDLLNEESISYLIDLQKKDPAAITKLLKDSGTNPLELDLESEHGYETKDTYTVSDDEVNLDGILDDIRDTESFAQTIDIVSNKWDAKSKQVLVNNPDVIKTINEHVATGIYDKIAQVTNRERILGNLDGMSDLDAYKYVGDAMYEAGEFDNTQPVDQKPSDEKPAKTVDPKVNKRKKAAGSTKPTVTKKKKSVSDFDPLSMSDEDFEKASTEGLFK